MAVRVAIDSLARTMDVSRSQAGRLVMTESAAIASAAKQDCYFFLFQTPDVLK